MKPDLLMPHRHLSLFFVASLLLLSAAVVPVGSAARPRLVRIVKAPPARTGDTKAVFRLKRARATRTRCRIDGRRYRRCRVRARYPGLRPGRHIFRVRARRGGRTAVVRHRWTIVQGANAPQRKLLFADEFNGSSLDITRWNAWYGPGHGGNGLRRPSAISVSGGSLAITAKMVNGKLESGGMSHKQHYRYGRYEFRVRTERDRTWTMSGIVMTWPQRQWSPEFTENDMYETGPSTRDRFRTFIHYGGSTRSQKSYGHPVDATQWHTIAMDWRRDSLKMYRDGRRVWTLNDKVAIPDGLHHVGIQLDARYTRRLRAPVRMYVDYMRIYE